MHSQPHRTPHRRASAPGSCLPEPTVRAQPKTSSGPGRFPAHSPKTILRASSSVPRTARLTLHAALTSRPPTPFLCATARSGTLPPFQTSPDQHTSCQVLVDTLVVLVPLQILARNEAFDPVLDDLGLRLEELHQLLRHLRDELRVRHCLARLHHAHDRGLHRVLAVLIYSLFRRLLLVLGHLGHEQRHLDLSLSISEFAVESETIGVGDLLRLRVLGEDLVLGE
mmetsp:Transcript_8194/g.19391  ORF Transcript_8194/g.19391 Transcript_8194/m.19391 type:complete len:225 (+) Transcript_8194:530-1204(+)